MELFKRILSFILVLVLLVGAMPPVAAQAEQREETVPAETTDPTEAAEPAQTTECTEASESTEPSAPPEPPEVTRAQWISALTGTFDMKIEDSNYPDNYFLDLTEDSEYYYDLLLAVEFGVLDIPAGGNVNPDGAATRSFAASTLNFCLGYQGSEEMEFTFSDLEAVSDPVSAQVAVDRGWLVCEEGAFMPEKPITAVEMDTMLADAGAILAEDEIDEDHENTVILSDGVVEVPMGTAVDFVSDAVLEVTDCPVSLTKGTVFVVYNQNLPLAFKALDVEQEGNITRVSYTRDGAEAALAACEYEGVLDLDLSTFVPEDENTTYSIQQTGGSGNPMARGIQYDEATQTLTVKKTFNASSGFTGNVTAVITNLKLEVKNSDTLGDYRYVLRGNATTTLDFTVKDKSDLLKPLKLGVIPVGGIGYITVELELAVSGTVALVWEGDVKGGFAYNVDHGTRLIHNFHKRNFTLYAKVEADLGVKVSAMIDVLLFQGSIYLKYGGKSTVTAYDRQGRVPERCLDSFSYFYAHIGVSGKLLGIAGISKPLFVIYDENNTPYRTHYHYEAETADSMGKLVYKCTYSDAPTYYTPPSSENFKPSIGSGIWDSTRQYWYDLDDNDNAVITAYCGSSSVLVLPEKLDEYPVAGIEEYAFYGNPKITSIKLPDSLEFIRASAFEGCTELMLVWTEGTNLRWIGDSAFRDCTALQQFLLPDSVTSLGTDVFSGCTALHKISLPAGLSSVPERAFYGCSSLKTMVLPENTHWIDEAAFYGCTALESINLEHVGTLGKMAFYNCTALKEIDMHSSWSSQWAGYIFGNCASLEKINIHESITEIRDYVFRGCTGLKNLTIPDTVKTIGNYSFAECTGLRTLVLPDDMEKIPQGAFSGCTALTKVHLPEKLQVLDDYAFQDCTSLETLTIPCWAEIASIYYHPFAGCTGLKTVTIAPGGRYVTLGLLRGCTSVETVFLPDSIQEIGNEAFSGCSSLHTLDLGGSRITSIGDRAFEKCMSLETFIIPDTVTTLGAYAFAESGVQEIHLSNTLEVIGESAFFACKSLGKVNIPASLKEVKIHQDEYGNFGDGPFRGCDNLKEVTIEDGLKTIPSRMFSWCDGIEYIEIPASVTVIGSKAFELCSNLKTVIFHGELSVIADDTFSGADLRWLDLPRGLKKIGKSAFSHNHELHDVRFPDTLEEIGEKAFFNCSLKHVELPENLRSIGSKAFDWAENSSWKIPKSLESVGSQAFGWQAVPMILEDGATRVPGGLYSGTDITSTDLLVLPDTVTEFGSRVFADCKKLTDVKIPDSVTVLGESIFSGCTALTSVEIPDSVTDIHRAAFLGCSALESVKLPRTLESLKDRMFSGCGALGSLELPEQLTSIGYSVFSGCTALASLRLPDGVASIGADAFEDCTALESINIPEGLTRLEEGLFRGCTALTAMVIPENITEIGGRVFENCTALQRVELCEPLKTVGSSAFLVCSALEEIELPDTLETLGIYAFYGCTSLKTVKLSEALEVLEEYVFGDCAALEEIALPAKLKRVENNVFTGCSSLKRLYIGRNLQYFGGTYGGFPAAPLDIYSVPGYYMESWAESNGHNFHASSTGAVKATGITWDRQDITVLQGAYVYLNSVPVVTPGNATSPVSYASSDTDVLYFRDSNRLYAAAPGTATVTAAVDDLTVDFRVTVVQPMRSVKLDVAEASLNCGETLQLNASCSIEGTTNQDFIWSSSSGCARVDENGLVTAVKQGTAVITATASDGSGSKASCTVTVPNTVTVREVTSPRYLVLSYTNSSDGSRYYPNNLEHTLIYRAEGAVGMTLVFHEDTALEDGKDFLYIYDGADQLVATLTGWYYKAREVYVPGDTVKLRTVTDAEGSGWGYEVVDLILEKPYCGHEYTAQTADATCIRDGLTEYTCTLCGHSYQETVPALGHDYADARTEPGCVTAGYKCRNCLRCGISHRYQQTADPLGHDYTELRVDTTCETDGYVVRTCERCGDVDQYSLGPAYGHNVQNGFCLYCLKSYVNITVQPADVTAAEGETAAVTLEAVGNGLQYQWYYRNPGSDKFLPTNAFTGPEYSVTMSQARHGRQVYCVITCAEGYSVTSDTATLFLASMYPEIVSQSESVTVPAGETAELTVVASGEGLTYEWYCRKPGETDFRKDDAVTGPTWSVAMSEEWDGCEVYCSVTDLYGRTAYSFVMVVSLPKGIQILCQPQDVVAAKGELAEVTVEASGDGLTYAWFCRRAEETEFSQYEAYTDNKWFVTMGPFWTGCEVYCEISDRFGTTVRSRIATLSMPGGSLQILKDISNVTVAAGETAAVTVEASGEELTYTWYYMDLEDCWFTPADGVTGNSYSVVMSEDVDGRQVYCVITDRNGESLYSATATLSMEGSPLRILTEPEDVSVNIGEPAFVNIRAAGVELTYAWYGCDPGEETFSLIEGFEGTGYSATMEDAVNGRQVYCVITDKYGNQIQTKTVTLSIKGTRAFIFLQPSDVWAAYGQQAEVSLEAEGPGLTYEWYCMDPGETAFRKIPDSDGPVCSMTMTADADGRQVCCTVTDENGHQARSETATLHLIRNYVSIIAQPENTAVSSGETAQVTVEATGDGLTYTWYFSDDGTANFIKDPTVTGPVYSVTMDETVDGRQVYCTVTDAYGVPFDTATAVLSMLRVPLVIVRQPADTAVGRGETAVVTVEVTGENLSYEWYFRPVGEPVFYRAEEFTENSYAVTMNTSIEGRQVYCYITDGHHSVTTETVTLYMTSPAIEILVQPQNVTASAGQLATFHVDAAGEELTYTWYYAKPTSSGFRKVECHNDPSWSVTMDEQKDGWKVRCVITDPYGNQAVSHVAILTLYVPLEILTQPQNVTAAEGETATVTLEATGRGLTYQWYYKNPGSSKFSLTSAFTGPSYSVTMSQARSGRQIYCVITDADGSSVTTETVTLTMKTTAPEILRQPEDVTAAEGETAAVSVEALGEGLTYTWYYKNRGADSFSKTTAFTGPTYSVTMSESRDSRQVYCVVADKYGNEVTTDTVTLSMEKNRVSIQQQPVDAEAENGETAEVTVKAAGDGLTYTWYYKNRGAAKFSKTTAFTGPTYSVTMSESRDGRQVYCVITDAYGNSVTTDTVTLRMKQETVLEIITQPADVTVTEGETAEVTLEASGDGLTYEWYYKNAGGSKFTKTTSFTGPSYSIVMNAARSGRQVYCIVTDVHGNSLTTDTVTLTMEQAETTPLAIVTQPEGFTIAAGKTGKICVEATGDGLIYEWYYKNAASSKFTKTSTFTGPEYSLTMNASRSGRHVYCVITDKYGESAQTDIVTLNMASDLELLSQPQDITAGNGNTAEITVDAVGDGLKYTWYYRNAGKAAFTRTDTFTGDSYSLEMNSTRNGREVYCVITDAYGNTVATDVVTFTMAK